MDKKEKNNTLDKYDALERNFFEIKTYFKAIIAIAVFMGISGGYLIVQLDNTRESVAKLTTLRENLEKEIGREIDSQVESIKPKIDSLVTSDVINKRYHFRQMETRITELTEYLHVSVPVKKGDIIHGIFNGVARNSFARFRIETNGSAKELLNSSQLISNDFAPDTNVYWNPIMTQGVFQAEDDTILEFYVTFYTEPDEKNIGKMYVRNPTLVIF